MRFEIHVHHHLSAGSDLQLFFLPSFPARPWPRPLSSPCLKRHNMQFIPSASNHQLASPRKWTQASLGYGHPLDAIASLTTEPRDIQEGNETGSFKFVDGEIAEMHERKDVFPEGEAGFSAFEEEANTSAQDLDRKMETFEAQEIKNTFGDGNTLTRTTHGVPHVSANPWMRHRASREAVDKEEMLISSRTKLQDASRGGAFKSVSQGYNQDAVYKKKLLPSALFNSVDSEVIPEGSFNTSCGAVHKDAMFNDPVVSRQGSENGIPDAPLEILFDEPKRDFESESQAVDLQKNADGRSDVVDSLQFHDSGELVHGKRNRRARVIYALEQGKGPIEVLKSLPLWNPVEFWAVVDYLGSHRRFDEALQVFDWWKGQEKYSPREQHYISFIRLLGIAHRPDVSQHLFNEMKTLGIEPSVLTYTTLLQSYAESGFCERAEEILQQMLECGVKPSTVTYTGLIYAYGKRGLYDDMNRVFNNMKRRRCIPDIRTYSCLIRAYSKGGLLRRMEKIWKEMQLNGWKPDSTAINAIIQGYAESGLIGKMHSSYMLLKDYNILINQDTIRAMSSTYIHRSSFHQMRLFVKDVGLKRKNVGNLLWNLLLITYAANFQMKNLQRGCEAMKESDFNYDLTTFNVCALSYSRMQMFWELHITLLQMQSAGVVPDLVTFGVVVDTYLNGKVRFQKMFEELDILQMKGHTPDVQTDPLVFEAFGKGDFQNSAEILMQVTPRPYGGRWTYGMLLSFYLKRRAPRRNFQVNAIYSAVSRHYCYWWWRQS